MNSTPCIPPKRFMIGMIRIQPKLAPMRSAKYTLLAASPKWVSINEMERPLKKKGRAIAQTMRTKRRPCRVVIESKESSISGGTFSTATRAKGREREKRRQERKAC